MNQLDLAIHSTVHDGDISTQDLADLMGMSRQILLNKANFNTENAYFSPAQLIQLQNLTSNYSINSALQAMNKSKPTTSKSITHSLLSVTDEVGRIAHEFNRAAEDNHFSEREKADCIKQASKVLNAAESLVASLHAQEVGKIRAA